MPPVLKRQQLPLPLLLLLVVLPLLRPPPLRLGRLRFRGRRVVQGDVAVRRDDVAGQAVVKIRAYGWSWALPGQ